MGKIHRLSASLSNMIAAGEVVERPMQIVKELVENAIDAQASKIEIEINEGGIAAIKVSDNGIGMDFDDALLAFERHATSKILNPNDLWSISTMGFRGEALPSISSVSEVTLITSAKTDGCLVHYAYGDLKEHRIYRSNQGTSITVKGLFYQTPARLKHLKNANYESTLIHNLIMKFALSHPEISFTLINNERQSFKTTGRGNLLEVIYQIYGKDVAKSAIAVDIKDFDYQVKGYLIHPQFNRAKNFELNIFLNGRLTKPYNLQKKVQQAYRGLMMPDRYAICVLNITMDYQLVDVNVHPSKWEVRLSKQQQLEYLLATGLKDLLQQALSAPQVSLAKTKEETIVYPSFALKKEEVKQIIQDSIPREKEVYYQPELPFVAATEGKKEQPISEITEDKFKDLRVLAQLQGKYILAENKQGLYIIDQHAAAERINFEKFLAQFKQKEVQYHPLVVPLVIDISAKSMQHLAQINEKLALVHLHLASFGVNSVLLSEVPVWLQEVNLKQLIIDLLDLFEDEQEVTDVDLMYDRLATMACHHSIRFNHYLDKYQMEQLLSNLKKCQQPYNCPHGRPTFICLTMEELVKEFKR